MFPPAWIVVSDAKRVGRPGGGRQESRFGDLHIANDKRWAKVKSLF